MIKSVLVIIVTLFITVFIPFSVLAQEQDTENLRVGVQTGTQLLADISVSHFEDADTWTGRMSVDQGIIFSMKRKGKPLEVPDINPNDGTRNDYVLGVKVAFTQRGYSHFSLTPPRPVKIPGITKAVTLWVCGRSFKHRLYLNILDYKGGKRVLDMGLLDFVGWKKLSIAIPASIEQDNYNNTEWRGISFTGFVVKCNPSESSGVYYVYFDELRAVTDIYNEEYRDEDNMNDGW